MVEAGGGGVEQRHKPVPHQLVDKTTVGQHDLGQEGKLCVEELDDLVWGQLVGQFGEIGEVQKEGSDRDAHPTQLGGGRAAQQALDQRLCHILAQPLVGRKQLALQVGVLPPQLDTFHDPAHAHLDRTQPKGFGQIIVGSPQQRFDSQVFGGQCAGHDDARQRVSLAQLGQDLEPAEAREHHVEQHQVWANRFKLCDRLLAVQRLVKEMSFRLQDQPNQPAGRQVWVDNQDLQRLGQKTTVQGAFELHRSILPISGACRRQSETRRVYSCTTTKVPGLDLVLENQLVLPSQVGPAQSNSHLASAVVMLMQPRLIGLPKSLCQ